MMLLIYETSLSQTTTIMSIMKLQYSYPDDAPAFPTTVGAVEVMPREDNEDPNKKPRTGGATATSSALVLLDALGSTLSATDSNNDKENVDLHIESKTFWSCFPIDSIPSDINGLSAVC